MTLVFSYVPHWANLIPALAGCIHIFATLGYTKAWEWAHAISHNLHRGTYKCLSRLNRHFCCLLAASQVLRGLIPRLKYSRLTTWISWMPLAWKWVAWVRVAWLKVATLPSSQMCQNGGSPAIRLHITSFGWKTRTRRAHLLVHYGSGILTLGTQPEHATYVTFTATSRLSFNHTRSLKSGEVYTAMDLSWLPVGVVPRNADECLVRCTRSLHRSSTSCLGT